jgi:hypothetical protein
MPNQPRQPAPAPDSRRAEALEELRAIRQEIAKLHRTFDAFAGAFLNAQFPYGKPADRWSRD